MLTSSRFQNALDKLYTAFHTNTLHPECYQQCAVGTICDQKTFWRHFTDQHGSHTLNYVGRVHQLLGKRFYGYTPQELISAEAAFLEGCGYALPLHHQTKNAIDPTDPQVQFEGLCAAIRFLADLEGQQDPLDIAALLDYTPRTTTNDLISVA